MKKQNLLSDIPEQITDELFQEIFSTDRFRLKRIISKGHCSPENEWYDQAENEWVLLVKGQGTLEFEDSVQVEMTAGDYLNIPAHKKHRVAWTDPETETLWLALYYP